MGKLTVTKTLLSGLLVIEPQVFGDDRGFFMEFYNRDSFSALGIEEAFVQDNHSRSGKGVLRGLHYQIPPAPMGKLVKCTRGKIFDVAVDIRKSSATFGRWHGETLSGDNHKMLYLPPGFAHGFVALDEINDVIYACTNVYTPSAERAILWNDPDINVVWPLDKVVVSDKDGKSPPLKEAETY